MKNTEYKKPKLVKVGNVKNLTLSSTGSKQDATSGMFQV